MKTLPLIVTVAASLFAVSGLHAQTTTTTTTTRSRARSGTITASNSQRLNAQRKAAERNAVYKAKLGPRTDGSLVRAFRSGNPLQMVNPAAPAEYGDGRDVTRHEESDPFQRPQGLRLFAFDF